jgi:hypothetical protein
MHAEHKSWQGLHRRVQDNRNPGVLRHGLFQSVLHRVIPRAGYRLQQSAQQRVRTDSSARVPSVERPTR